MKNISLFQKKSVKLFGNMDQNAYLYYMRLRDTLTLNPKIMTIREYYLENFPTDELGLELNETPTFPGLLNQLIVDGDIYRYIGVSDSLVRERLFERLAKELETSYEYVYNMWLN